VDWVLEALALVATLSAIALVAYYAPQIQERVWRGPFRPPGADPLGARLTLWLIAGIQALAYLGLTFAARGRGLFHIPDELERNAPHVRQMLFSMMIVMKAVLALFGTYLVWTLIAVAQRRGTGISGTFLTVFTLAVPVPLLFYTLKLRRYSSSK
jgi:hypothetical protein